MEENEAPPEEDEEEGGDDDDDDEPSDVGPAPLDEPDNEEEILEDVDDVALIVLAICFNSGTERLRSYDVGTSAWLRCNHGSSYPPWPTLCTKAKQISKWQLVKVLTVQSRHWRCRGSLGGQFLELIRHLESAGHWEIGHC